MYSGAEGNCESGKFGWSCALSCHCSDTDVCDTNGDCPNGCAADWTGPKCQITLGKFNHSSQLFCDTNGDCPSSCAAEWAGPKCQIALGKLNHSSP